MKKILKKILGILTIIGYSASTIVIPMPIYAEEVELQNQDEVLVPGVFFPLVAYFDGIENAVELDNNSALVPEEFTTGNVVIKAKVCTKSNGEIIPDDNSDEACTNKSEISLHCIGVINGSQINDTVRSFPGGVTINEGFNNYGKVSIHVAAENGLPINTLINLVTKNSITVRATSMLELSQSFGSVSSSSALLTSDNTGDVSIFFGNTETVLAVSGYNVDKITNVTGTLKESVLNADGSTLIKLPELTKETTTKVELTILMKDGTSVKRKVNLIRTAILLQHNNGAGDDSVYAGYVFNKSYLYNNQNHSDEIFNAYLQVMLYKDDVVVGYKQVKINDEEFINSLENDHSGSMELYSEDQIPIYGKATDDLIDGVNKVSVFLTNGPVSFDDQLPSIEFGIGSGVVLEWGQD